MKREKVDRVQSRGGAIVPAQGNTTSTFAPNPSDFVPQEILNLRSLSETLDAAISNQEKNSEMVGKTEAAAAVGRATANMKQYSDLIDEGKIQQSDNPWFNMGTQTGFARKAIDLIANNVNDQLLTLEQDVRDGKVNAAQATAQIDSILAGERQKALDQSGQTIYSTSWQQAEFERYYAEKANTLREHYGERYQRMGAEAGRVVISSNLAHDFVTGASVMLTDPGAEETVKSELESRASTAVTIMGQKDGIKSVVSSIMSAYNKFSTTLDSSGDILYEREDRMHALGLLGSIKVPGPDGKMIPIEEHPDAVDAFSQARSAGDGGSDAAGHRSERAYRKWQDKNYAVTADIINSLVDGNPTKIDENAKSIIATKFPELNPNVRARIVDYVSQQAQAKFARNRSTTQSEREENWSESMKIYSRRLADATSADERNEIRREAMTAFPEARTLSTLEAVDKNLTELRDGTRITKMLSPVYTQINQIKKQYNDPQVTKFLDEQMKQFQSELLLKDGTDEEVHDLQLQAVADFSETLQKDGATRDAIALHSQRVSEAIKYGRPLESVDKPWSSTAELKLVDEQIAIARSPEKLRSLAMAEVGSDPGLSIGNDYTDTIERTKRLIKMNAVAMAEAAKVSTREDLSIREKVEAIANAVRTKTVQEDSTTETLDERRVALGKFNTLLDDHKSDAQGIDGLTTEAIEAFKNTLYDRDNLRKIATSNDVPGISTVIGVPFDDWINNKPVSYGDMLQKLSKDEDGFTRWLPGGGMFSSYDREPITSSDDYRLLMEKSHYMDPKDVKWYVTPMFSSEKEWSKARETKAAEVIKVTGSEQNAALFWAIQYKLLKQNRGLNVDRNVPQKPIRSLK